MADLRLHRRAAGQAGPGGGRAAAADRRVGPHATNRTTSPLAKAAADRIASSLENVRLTGEQRRIAATLQASLLPDGAARDPRRRPRRALLGDRGRHRRRRRLLRRLRGAATDAGRVVVGDVCGTGPSAAAVTGLARHTIAAAAWHGDEPAAVLENLNRSMRARATDRFCSVAYGTLEPSASGGRPHDDLRRPPAADPGAGRRLRRDGRHARHVDRRARPDPGDHRDRASWTRATRWSSTPTAAPTSRRPTTSTPSSSPQLVGGAARRTTSSEALAEAIRPGALRRSCPSSSASTTWRS